MRPASALLSLLLLSCVPITGAQGTKADPKIVPTPSAEVLIDLTTGRFRIDASINGGAPTKIAFDTGSEGMSVPRSLVEKLKLPVIGQAMLGSPFGGEAIKVDVVKLDSLVVGGVRATALEAIVMDDNLFPGLEPLVIIGGVQFADKVIEIDFAKGALTLSASAPDKGGEWHALDQRGLLSADIAYGGKSFPLHIDSGNPGLLNLPESMATLLGVAEPMPEIGRIGVVDRMIALKAGKVDADVSIAGLPVHLGTVTFADIPSANIGLMGLRQFRILIDNPRRRWRLENAGEGPTILTLPTRPRPAG
jgi:Aspartyl protease